MSLENFSIPPPPHYAAKLSHMNSFNQSAQHNFTRYNKICSWHWFLAIGIGYLLRLWSSAGACALNHRLARFRALGSIRNPKLDDRCDDAVGRDLSSIFRLFIIPDYFGALFLYSKHFDETGFKPRGRMWPISVIIMVKVYLNISAE